MTVDRLEGDRVVLAQTSIAVADLRERSPGAGHLVALCCFLGADDIPRRLLLSGGTELPERLAESMRDPVSLIRAAAIIDSYGLMRVDGDAFSIHRQVQATVRKVLTEEDRRFWAASAGRIVLSAFPERPGESQHWSWAARLVPHALAATEYMERQDLEAVLRAQLLDRVARCLIPQGQLGVADDLLRRALAILEGAQPESALYASVLNDFAMVQREQGRFNAARRDARRALALHGAALSSPALEYRSPESHAQSQPEDDAREGVQAELPQVREIADDLQNLGIIARQRGELSEAFQHLKRVYDMRVTLDGEDAPSSAEALIDLFGVYVDAERYADGIDVLKRAVEIQETAYGPAAQDVIVNRQLLSILTAPEDADRKARDVVARQEAYFGPRHPQTADASLFLASLLEQLGAYDQARRMAQKALEIDRENYGATHFRVGTGLATLMSLEARSGDLVAAERCLREVVDVVLAAPSAERATILRLSALNQRLAELAVLDGAQGLVAEAETAFDEAFVEDESVWNLAREMVAAALLTAGDTLLYRGRYDEAAKVYRNGLRLALLTTENPLDDADFHIRLAVLVLLTGDESQAGLHFDEALQSLRAGGFRFAIWALLGQASPLYHLLERPPALVKVLDALYDRAAEEGVVTMFRPELTAPVPENWFTKGSTTLLAPDGQANVIASSEPLDPTMTVEMYAEVQGELLEREFPGYVLKSYESVSVLGGLQGYIRHFEWTPPDGVTVTQIQIYYVQTGRGYTATATTPKEAFAERELVLREVLRGLRLVGEEP